MYTTIYIMIVSMLILSISSTMVSVSSTVPDENRIEGLTSQDDLPLCDGSVQDCVMDDGTVCQAGTYEDECECEYDMSDCPKHPRYEEIVRPLIPDRYRDLPGSYECWADGYNDGERGEWDTDREHECYVSNIGSIYRQALEEGCLAGGFPEENCLEINH